MVNRIRGLSALNLAIPICDALSLPPGAYADLDDAGARIGGLIKNVCNTDRLHSGLGYRTPAAFAAIIRISCRTDPNAGAAWSSNSPVLRGGAVRRPMPS